MSSVSLRSVVKAGLQSASIMSIADITTQLAVEGRSTSSTPTINDDKRTHSDSIESNRNTMTTVRYDPKRTLRWATIGLTLHGPYFFYSFAQLDRVFGASTSLSVAVTKTIAGQLVVFPPYLTLLFSYMGLMEGMSSADIACKVQDRVPKAFMSGCIFWPVANLFNFSVVPVRWRVVYLASVGALWNGYLSYLNEDEVKEKVG